jgi:hypothetical protein
VGVGSVMLTQLAYRAGPLANSMPAITITDPAVSVMVGCVAFHELLADSPIALLWEIAGIALTVVAATRLIRSTGPHGGASTIADSQKQGQLRRGAAL